LKKKAAKGKSRRRGVRRARLRPLAGVVIFLLVAASAYFLHLYVSVTTRFDGRLWTMPSRVYSDVLSISPGDRLSPSALAARLERSGYASVGGRPSKTGQFRRIDALLEVYLRSFSAPTDEAPRRRVTIRFDGDRVRAIRDDRGLSIRRAVIEPELLATFHGPRHEDRELIRFDQIPAGFIDAVLATEDSRFHSHHGLDVRGIMRAVWVNIREARVVQGGSTITQQTVKNLYLGQERSWWRKLREVPMAIILDGRYSKDRILEVYLNAVYLGQRGSVAICGVQSAARFYFGRQLQDLSLGEWALLAGMIRSPGSYNPFAHPERALARRAQVLRSMQRLELVGEGEVEAAMREELELASGGGGYADAPYAVDFVRSRLAQRYSRRVLMEEGLNVYTTIDTALQQRAEAALQEGLHKLERDVPALRRQAADRELQGALLASNPATGAILAMVGGRDYGKSQFNRIAQARRQPGSCFKPFVFAGGFELAAGRSKGGITPATVLDDSPLELESGGESWRPSNFDGDYRGEVTARQALEESLNIPTVRAALHIGLDEIIATARDCGIESPLPPLPSLALGAAEVTPLELAAAYGAFSQAGVGVTPWIIRAVTDRNGERMPGRGIERRRALSPQTAYQMNDILRGVFERGTARTAAAMGFHGDAAGKTGTTDGTRDSWFVGYSGDLLALVWVGYDDNSKTTLTGATGALPIWVEFMRDFAEPAAPSRPFRPHDMVRVLIDTESGLRAGPRCPSVREEWFVPGTEPKEECELHRGRLRRWLRRVFGRDNAV
jgi:penicillin-binding protein 1B